MSDREPKIGDVIRCTIKNSAGRYSTCVVEEFNYDLCVKECASGRWVIVDPQPQGEPGPAADTATTREGAK